MATSAGTVELLARELSVALGVLEERLADGGADEFFAELGTRLPQGFTSAGELAIALSDAASTAGELAPLVEVLTQAIADNDVLRIISAGKTLLEKVDDVLAAVTAVSNTVNTVAESFGGLDPGLRAEIQAFAAVLPRKVLDFVIIEYAAQRAPATLGALDVLGLLVRARQAAPEGDSLHPGHERRELHLERLPKLLDDPGEHFRQVYGWGESTFDGRAFFEALHRFVERDLEMPAVLLKPEAQPPLLEAYIIGMRVDGATNPPALAADVRFGADQTFTRTYPLRDPWQLNVAASGAFAVDTRAQVTPPLHVALIPPGGTANVDLSAALIGDAGGTTMMLLGAAGGTRLQATRVELAFRLEALWDPATGRATTVPGLSATIQNGRLILSLGGADGFLASVLPSTMEVSIDLDALWDPEEGLSASGGAGLQIVVPLTLNIGPVRLERASLRVVFTDDVIAVHARVAGDISLGPFDVTVDGVGGIIELALRDGNLGPLNLEFRFLPPTGLGLAIDASPVKGGGFIGFDESAGRYSGAFEVELARIGIQAVALLDTQVPRTEQKFALLVLLRASFPPIQMGFGFALSSVGGLLALNRRIDVDALRERMATGTAGRVLAPEDPMRNAPLLLADLATVFPPAEGIAVVGPTLQLSWTELVRFDVGVFLELPGPRKVVLLGSARAAVENPSGGRPYLQIRLDIFGVLDVARQTVAFDAVLIDSHLLEILELTGGAAFRLSWGAEPYVVLTVGGFHPAYSPAPLVFPASLTRIAMVRGAPTDALYLRFEGYFAITTNTLQFGASVEAIINMGKFNIRGFLGFDALIRFQPLHFQVAIEASVQVRWKSRKLGGLTLRGRLSGPGPVVFHGRVCFEVMWWDICFEETFTLGSSNPPAVTPVPSALAELVRELEDPRNVRAVDAIDPWVAVEPAEGTSLPIISPVGQAVWSQDRAPLRLLLQRFEGAPLRQPESVTATGQRVTGDEVDWFAPGGYAELTDADALNRRAFERLTAGVRLGVKGIDAGPSAELHVTIQVIRLPAPPTFVAAHSLPSWLQRAAAARTGAVERDVVVPKLAIRDEEWALRTGPAVTTGLSQAQAHQLSRVAGGGTAVATTDIIGSMAF